MKKLLLALLIFLPAAAQAADYAPGTIGFLYESCQKALESSRNLPELHASYCGAFVEGYLSAYAISIASTAPLQEQADDPCASEKKKFYERINTRFCSHLPFYDEKKVSAAFALRDMTDIISRWILYLKERSGSDPFELRAAGKMESLLRPGAFCDGLAVRETGTISLFVTNPALQDISWKDSLQLTQSLTFAGKYAQCESDLVKSAGDPARFRATRCGAEIDGFIAGLHAAAPPPLESETVSPECRKQVARLYKSLDVSESMCVTPDADPIKVAEIFSEQVDRKSIAAKKVIPASVGYEAIYRGFLCVAKHANGSD